MTWLPTRYSPALNDPAEATDTVIATVPDLPPAVAVTVVVPAASAVTVPEAETVATAVLLEVQVGVIVALVPSL